MPEEGRKSWDVRRAIRWLHGFFPGLNRRPSWEQPLLRHRFVPGLSPPPPSPGLGRLLLLVVHSLCCSSAESNTNDATLESPQPILTFTPSIDVLQGDEVNDSPVDPSIYFCCYFLNQERAEDHLLVASFNLVLPFLYQLGYRSPV